MVIASVIRTSSGNQLQYKALAIAMVFPRRCIQVSQARVTGSICPESTMVTLTVRYGGHRRGSREACFCQIFGKPLLGPLKTPRRAVGNGFGPRGTSEESFLTT